MRRSPLLKHQLEWFRRQIFGPKSERFTVLEPAHAAALGETDRRAGRTLAKTARSRRTPAACPQREVAEAARKWPVLR